MLELPEAFHMSNQIENSLKGKKILTVTLLQSPHKLTWFNGDPTLYESMLLNKKITKASSLGGMVKIDLEEITLLFSDGVNLRYFQNRKNLPKKHQLLLEFSDSTYLCSSTQMYGGIICFRNGEYENDYYSAAKEKPSPLKEEFSLIYFKSLMKNTDPAKMSAKAFLATEQRIPGIGNGVLQDILYNASVHPKRRMDSLTVKELEKLFISIKSTLKEMCENGGRDTEKDLFGNYGGYRTILSKKTSGRPCPACGTAIEKESYMGGSIYFCRECQRF